MEDEEDLRKIKEYMNKQTKYENNYQLEFHDFINFKQDFSDHELESENHQTSDPEDEASLGEPSAESSTSVLTEEERLVINSCTDPKLKQILTLNRAKSMALIKLHQKMKNLLTECDQMVEEKDAILKNSESKQINQQTYIWKLAAPYFKDKKFFPSPLNADAIRKRAKNELNVYDLVSAPKWAPIEIDRLTNAVKCNYNINRQNAVVQKISALKATLEDECDDKRKVGEILLLKQELEDLKKNDDEVPPLGSNAFINWCKVSETFLKEKHTASECQSVWHILVHPQINKSEWSDEENKVLEVAVKRHSHQNWDEIALELGTSRTGFTTCLHYHSKLCEKFKRNKFTPDEDALLTEVVESYRIGSYIPWNKVVCHFTNRSRHQLYHRYKYFLSQNHVKKGKFSESEDILLLILVNKFGKNFKKCSEYMPHRSQIQLKSRYSSNLQRDIRKGTFTSEDDQIIFDHAQKFGEKNWSGLTAKLNRCNAQIRQRYKLIKEFLRAKPDAAVSEIPKRKHRFDYLGKGQHSFIHYMAEQYRDCKEIPTLPNIEDSLKAEIRIAIPDGRSTETNCKTSEPIKLNAMNVDTMIVDFFSEAHDQVSESNAVEAADNVAELLAVLGAELNIPKDFECNIHLDETDIEILQRIAKKKFATKECRLVSPNIGTLIGLRSLIIKHKEYKTQQKNKQKSKPPNLSWQMQQSLRQLSESNRSDVLYHRDLFTKRFDKLFSWSAILSLEKPSQTDLDMEHPRTYKRKTGTADGVALKKQKIDSSVLSSLKSGNRKVSLVDKSVVERLTRNKFDIIRLEPVTGADGVVRPILQQDEAIPSNGTPSDNENETNMDVSVQSNCAPSDSVVETEDTDADVQDIQKLNVILKSMKSEVKREVVRYSDDEYEAIEEDVRLMNEVLLKVKAEPSGY